MVIRFPLPLVAWVELLRVAGPAHCGGRPEGHGGACRTERGIPSVDPAAGDGVPTRDRVEEHAEAGPIVVCRVPPSRTGVADPITQGWVTYASSLAGTGAHPVQLRGEAGGGGLPDRDPPHRREPLDLGGEGAVAADGHGRHTIEILGRDPDHAGREVVDVLAATRAHRP